MSSNPYKNSYKHGLWMTYPYKNSSTSCYGDEAGACSVLEANFAVGFVAGSLEAAVTRPLDVVTGTAGRVHFLVKQQQISKAKDFIQSSRNGGIKGLFPELDPRVSRAGPVQIVVSFYQVAKALYFTVQT
ncbi:manganese tracking factor for mitochondrial SOD2 [Hibiscus trionum]|uniref:Manganese tracking factor for mitochondrial SOD2 n=1 Tax=Hibiscus trionum TaxID=183268 RepID=A0A9W7MGF7_HIBTR|nr:manganese tracking factor for mitochondrial SOD2 [Hibiscus trionum]